MGSGFELCHFLRTSLLTFCFNENFSLTELSASDTVLFTFIKFCFCPTIEYLVTGLIFGMCNGLHIMRNLNGQLLSF